jgi:hypothetical protein
MTTKSSLQLLLQFPQQNLWPSPLRHLFYCLHHHLQCHAHKLLQFQNLSKIHAFDLAEPSNLLSQHEKQPKPPLVAKIAITNSTEAITTPSEPLTYEEALASPERDLWINAIHEELESLARHKTWQLVPRPQYRNVIGTKWVFKIKDTIPRRFKARLVAQGYSQIPGIDYNETFAPVVKSTSVRTLFAIAVQEELHIYQFDIETAFLNSILQEEIFVALPPGFINPLAGDHVLKLLKALYGLKQASNVWATAFKHAMDKLNFVQSTADDSIFISPPESPHLSIVAIYVDDILIFCKNIQAINDLASQLRQSFRIREMGPVTRFLGIDILRPNLSTLYISHTNYAKRILAKFNMEFCNPAKTPFETQTTLTKTSPDDEPTDAEHYRAITGSIMHLAVYSRPDIMYAASKLAQFNSNPSMQHCKTPPSLHPRDQRSNDHISRIPFAK